MTKVATFVSGRVPTSEVEKFESGYRSLKSSPLPPGLERSFLLKSLKDPGAYTIQTIWGSREALDSMRSSEKPKAVAAFEAFGVVPQVEIQEIAEMVP